LSNSADARSGHVPTGAASTAIARRLGIKQKTTRLSALLWLLSGMVPFTQADVDQLIGCAKEISEAPARELKLDGAHWRNDAKLVASDGTKGSFSMFLRKSEDFPENFSIGLSYSPNDGRSSIMLLRCNGKHGPFNNGSDPDHPHWHYHIHRASERAMEAGSAPEKYAEKTMEFASYEEALQYFLRAVNLNAEDSSKHFPAAIQTKLFER